MPRLIGYARVSTIDQNPERQLDALRGAACDLIYWEKCSSAADARPELDAAIGELGEGDTLLVSSLSRASRDNRHTWEIIEAIETRGASLRSLGEPIDTNTAAGRAWINFHSMMNQWERERLKERTLEGLAAARRRGRVGGRRPALSREREREALTMLDQGFKQRRVADIFAVSERTIQRLVKRARVVRPPTDGLR